MRSPAWPFLGSEAVAAGRLRKHELRRAFRALYPDVYIPADVTPTTVQRAVAAWLWTGRRGVVAGSAAAALHGVRWFGDGEPVELVWSNARPPAGIRTRRDRLGVDEVTTVAGVLITSPARTAFDLGRLTVGDSAVARLDALSQAVPVDVTAVLDLARRHSGSPGIPRLRNAMALHDPGAESPRETWLRLLLLRAGFPRARTQIPVVDGGGRVRYYLDMGWEDLKVAVEYDGEHHRERSTFSRDIVRTELLAELGWRVVRVASGHLATDIIERVGRARAAGVRSARDTAPDIAI